MDDDNYEQAFRLVLRRAHRLWNLMESGTTPKLILTNEAMMVNEAIDRFVKVKAKKFKDN